MQSIHEFPGPRLGPQQKPILLLVGEATLTSDILSESLGTNLPARCHVISPRQVDYRATDASLVLFDCDSLNERELRLHTDALHRTGREYRATFINATQESPAEQLLQWPAIKGIFYRNCSQHLLLKGLRAVLDGDIWIPRRLLHRMFEKQRANALPLNEQPVPLTRRERQVLSLTLSAFTNGDIAGKLHLSEHTVKSHLYNIFRKIGARNRMEASKWAQLYLDDPFA